ncbi:hypothetical protein [Virgibacillus sediminis]|uniref:Uncharacterized protein n=1 Tax=Virgibacillus sediminis TaxID=202260 RepID=A0ABV7A0Z9_9BACI
MVKGSLQRFSVSVMALVMLVGSFSFGSPVTAHETSEWEKKFEEMRSLYEYQEKNPEVQHEITEKKEIKANIRWINKIRNSELLDGLNMKDLRDTHVTTQYLGKIDRKYDVNASVFEYNKDEEGWAIIVLYDVDRKKLVDMVKLNHTGDQAEVTNYLTGNTVDLDEEVEKEEEKATGPVILWHPPGEQDLWNDPNCEWAAVFYCGIMGFLTTPWGSIACSAGWAALCH